LREFFAAKLRHETDPSDVAAARAGGERIVLVDVRDATGWDQGHIPGAVHLPLAEILGRLDELPPVGEDPQLVVYCWGPGCNGSTKAALVLARAGYRNAREMIGGCEYWARKGCRSRLPPGAVAARLTNWPDRCRKNQAVTSQAFAYDTHVAAIPWNLTELLSVPRVE
jgi:rhodanese-related sulfurtransferase